MSSPRARRARRQAWLSGLLLAGILVSLLVLAEGLRWRLDLTADRQHTLSPATLALLGRLEDRLELKLYFNRDVEGAEAILPARLQVVDLLEEIAARGGERVSLEVVDPTADRLLASHAQQVGIVPAPLGRGGVGSVAVVQIYQGLELRYLDRTEVIPFVVPAEFEFAFASRLASLLRGERPVIGFVSREPPLPPPVPGIELPVPEDRIYEELREILGQRYAVRDLDLEAPDPPVADLVAMIVARPEELSSREVFEIDRYLAGGGHVLILHDHERYDPKTFERHDITTGLDGWLEEQGIRILPRFVYDSQAQELVVGRRRVTLPDGRFQVVPVRLPYGLFPRLSGDSLAPGHVVTGQLDQVVLMWAHPVVAGRLPDGVQAEVLLRSSPRSWILPRDVPVALTPESIQTLDARAVGSGPPQRANLAVVLRGRFPSRFPEPPPGREGVAESRPGVLVVIGDGDLFQNVFLQAGSANAIFALNLVDWLAQDESLIGLRSRGEGQRSLRSFYREYLEERAPDPSRLSPEERQRLDRDARRYQRLQQRLRAWGNTLGPPLLVLLAALLVWRWRRVRAARPWRPPVPPLQP